MAGCALNLDIPGGSPVELRALAGGQASAPFAGLRRRFQQYGIHGSVHVIHGQPVEGETTGKLRRAWRRWGGACMEGAPALPAAGR